jgi:ACS family hexuronate transporter-like MFS transporter
VNGPPESARSNDWKWLVCGLLLAATMINYMDRQTLSGLSARITKEFRLSQEQYGNLELAFGWAFAAGSLGFGFLVDRFAVRWVYPLALLAWSAAGFATSFARDYDALLVCRTLLGFFEAGHWPCALLTIHRILARSDRHLGNSILQSGASVGAITTPILIRVLVGDDMTPGAWRQPFWVIGLIGPFWIVAWFLLVRRADLKPRDEDRPEPGTTAPSVWADFPWRRFAALLIMVTALNGTWQLIRAWLPKFLQESRGYTEGAALDFTSVFYIATDIGCIGAGALSFRWARRGMPVHTARLLVYAICCALTALTAVVAVLPAGWPLLGLLLIVGAGALGLFPCYYSFSQELSPHHIGKVTGVLASIAWFLSSPLQTLFGKEIDRIRAHELAAALLGSGGAVGPTRSYDLGMTLVGLLPLAGLLAMLTLWGRERPSRDR